MNKAISYYIDGLRKYAVFRGRASRREFWYFYLFNFLIAMLIGFVSGVVAGITGLSDAVAVVPADLFILAMGIPSWAVLVRRCHDIGLNPWWSLTTVIPFIGLLVLIGIGIQDSQPGPNRYGPNPNDANVDSAAVTALSRVYPTETPRNASSPDAPPPR